MGNMERCKEVVLIFKFSQSKIIFFKKRTICNISRELTLPLRTAKLSTRPIQIQPKWVIKFLVQATKNNFTASNAFNWNYTK